LKEMAEFPRQPNRLARQRSGIQRSGMEMICKVIADVTALFVIIVTHRDFWIVDKATRDIADDGNLAICSLPHRH